MEVRLCILTPLRYFFLIFFGKWSLLWKLTIQLVTRWSSSIQPHSESDVCRSTMSFEPKTVQGIRCLPCMQHPGLVTAPHVVPWALLGVTLEVAQTPTPPKKNLNISSPWNSILTSRLVIVKWFIFTKMLMTYNQSTLQRCLQAQRFSETFFFSLGTGFQKLDKKEESRKKNVEDGGSHHSVQPSQKTLQYLSITLEPINRANRDQ